MTFLSAFWYSVSIVAAAGCGFLGLSPGGRNLHAKGGGFTVKVPRRRAMIAHARELAQMRQLSLTRREGEPQYRSLCFEDGEPRMLWWAE